MSKAKEYLKEFDGDWGLTEMNHKTLEDVEAKENDLLNLFCLFLEDNNYLDTDWRTEEPFGIDEFRKSKQYSNWKEVLKKIKL